jgi:hypothetical protein
MNQNGSRRILYVRKEMCWSSKGIEKGSLRTIKYCSGQPRSLLTFCRATFGPTYSGGVLLQPLTNLSMNVVLFAGLEVLSRSFIL